MSRAGFIACAYGIGYAVAGIALLWASVSTGQRWMGWVGSGLVLGVFMLIGNALSNATRAQASLRWTIASVLLVMGMIAGPLASTVMPPPVGDIVGWPILLGLGWMFGNAASELPLWRSFRRPRMQRDRPHGTGKCHACSYDLSASRNATQCPECGTVIDRYAAFGTHCPVEET